MHIDPRPRAVTRRMRPGTIDTTRVVPLSEGLIEADHSFAAQAVSHAAAELLGWDRPAALTRALNETDWAPFDPDVRRDLRFSLALRGRWQGPARLRRRDGSEVQTFVTACALNGSPGVPKGIVLALRPSNAIDERALGASQGDSIAVTGLPGHFCLFYQPEIDLTDGTVTSCEALLRWWHPGLGIVSPGAALADRRWATRLAGVEVWSIFAACRQAAAWAAEGRPVPVSINLSATHLLDPELIDRLRRALVVTGVDPGRITVDLPACTVVGAPARLRQVTRAVRNLGVRVAIDDVAADLTREALGDNPVDTLKIARGAGRTRPDRPAPGAAVIDLARSIGATTVAKTVETTAELDQLRSLGCDRAFGHLFVPPMPPTDLAGLLWPRGADNLDLSDLARSVAHAEVRPALREAPVATLPRPATLHRSRDGWLFPQAVAVAT